jgi:outer membrane lipoprotein SlyB
MKYILSFAIIMLITGCAQTTGWRPVVDAQMDPNAYNIQRDMNDCGRLASEAAGTASSIAMGTAVGALGGAATGAAIGAVVGNPATGAALGSIAGIGGGMYSGMNADSRYRLAYSNCMKMRGHPVIN